MLLHTILQRISWGVLCLAPGIAVSASAASDADIEYFESNVRPILAERCYECHGPDEQESNMRLDHITFVLKGGDFGPALVPGDAAESNMVEGINWIDPEFQMPPKKKLSDSEIETLTGWIKMGAPWPDEPLPEAASSVEEFDLAKRKNEHWAWQPIRNPAVPSSTGSSMSANPIDAFIQVKLDAEGLVPATRADKRTLVRRLYFDLIGLPPSPRAVNDFVVSDDSDAYAQLVDELLSHPGFGERWGRHWLDITRFAESYGHEGDFPIREAWRYRDYVIRALNADLPYDQFVREQIAGDLIESPRMHPEDGYNESIIATGWWFMHQATHGPVDVVQDEADRIDNQIDVLGKAFLGLTVACARCHDHKFDAISTEDYYSLTSYLRSSRQQFAFLDRFGEIESVAGDLRKLQQDATPIANQSLAALSQYTKNIAEYLNAVQEMVGDDFDIDAKEIAKPSSEKIAEVAVARGLDVERTGRWVDSLLHKYLTHSSHPFRPWTRLMSDKPTDYDPSPIDSEVFASFDSGSFEGWTVYGEAFGNAPTTVHEFSPADASTTLIPKGVVHSGRTSKKLKGVLRSPTFTLSHDSVHFRVAGKNSKINIVIQQFQITEFNDLLFGGAIARIDSGPIYNWRTQVDGLHKYRGLRAYIEIIDDSEDGWIAVDEIRFSNQDAVEHAVGSALDSRGGSLEKQTGLAEAYEAWARDGFRSWEKNGADSATAGYLNFLLANELIDLEGFEQSASGQALAKIRRPIVGRANDLPPPIVVLAMDAREPAEAQVFIRGNHKAPGEPTPARFLEALGARGPEPESMRDGRLQLANAILAHDNPLTSRVLVNRLWHHLFGRGIVESVDNFGVLGRAPTHPDLLDYLATYFRENGQSIKHVIRHIVMSETYAMSSDLSDARAELHDPANTYFHRQNVRRLEGEIIRDAILAVSGRLNKAMYGNSIPPYLSAGETSHRRPKQTGPVDAERRRSIYMRVQRNFLSPMMLAFDMPLPDTAIGKRTVSNVPAQSLIMMNDILVSFQARMWANTLMARHPDSIDARIKAGYLDAFGRVPAAAELNQITVFIHQQAAGYDLEETAILPHKDLWKDFCHILFMSKEFIYIG